MQEKSFGLPCDKPWFPRGHNLFMSRVTLGMIGLGTVGQGVVRLLSGNKNLVLKKVAVANLQKARQVKLPSSCELTNDVSALLNDPEIEILIEVMGGEMPALDFMLQAIEKRKHIITANKEVLAKHGPTLFEKARAKGVDIFFEAAVAGGLPLISTIHKGLEANEISSVVGIMNGTTNYILSQMTEKGIGFDVALSDAQKQGFAEADPSADVDGHDVSYKLSILSALAYGRFAKPTAIYKESIRKLNFDDIKIASELGYAIKLIGVTKSTNDKLDVLVAPMLVPASHVLAAVSSANNGILVHGSAVGEIVMVGPGAGQMPTASAIVGDTINLANALQLPDFSSYFQPEIETSWADVNEVASWQSPYYLHLIVNDTPGVIGHIGTIFGEHNISIRSLIQKDTKKDEASIVIITHQAQKANMDKAIEKLQKSAFLKELKAALHIFQPETNHAQ